VTQGLSSTVCSRSSVLEAVFVMRQAFHKHIRPDL